MPLFGTLNTMPLPDLLQWLGGVRKTGTLQVERNRVRKWILMQDGRIVGCSSDDPPERLGQFLLSRGKITEDQLRIALAAQDGSDKHLGKIFIEMGALTPEDLSAHLEAKAEETIYSVFDWDDAVFRFHEELAHNDNIFRVELRVEDVLLRGMKRYDDLKRVREVLHDPGIVLRPTAKRPPDEVYNNTMARSLYEAIDGERTVAEILLHVHGSEYLVTKFLYELLRNGFLEIVGIRQVQQQNAMTGTDNIPTSESIPAHELPHDAYSGGGGGTGTRTGGEGGDRPLKAVPDPVDLEMPDEMSEPTDVEAIEDSSNYQFEKRLARARSLMSQGEFAQALGVLDELYRQDPNNESLRLLNAEAEAAFIEKAYRHYVPPGKIPVLLRPVDQLESENLSPSEFFLLSRFDGTWDIRSIISIAPLREVETLLTLKRLREKGVIELRDPVEA